LKAEEETGETCVEMANYRIYRMLKVKVKVMVKVTLGQFTKAHRGSRSIALLFL
jgi:hypothetical protein